MYAKLLLIFIYLIINSAMLWSIAVFMGEVYGKLSEQDEQKYDEFPLLF